MDKIIDRFNRDFARWGIRLPLYAVKERGRGKIVKAGWAIWYRFGFDSRGEYLDHYAIHRMTDDRHTRFYEDGHIEHLETIRTIYRVTEDPDENARIKAEFYAKNREIAARLAEKGFKISGDEPGAIQINRFLYVWPNSVSQVGNADNKERNSLMDLRPGFYTAEFQAEFLTREIQFLTLQAALSTKNHKFPVYAPDVSDADRFKFRTRLVRDLERLSIRYVPGRVLDEEHSRIIKRFAKAISRRCGDLLHKGEFRIGVAQKALNLYLKYLWCLGEIAEPPHCPFDRIVISNLGECVNWTEFNDIDTYDCLVRKARIEAGDLSIAEWELRLFNQH